MEMISSLPNNKILDDKKQNFFVDEKGRIKLPEEILQLWGITPETELSICQTSEGILLQRIDPQLSRLYIEPTNACNLNCRTCVRHSWDEPTGMMDMEIFRNLIGDLSAVPSLQKVSFWGIGEPLLHPDIVEMVALAKQLGVETQMITNAMLLDRKKAEGLIDAGLDSIVVSVDGTTIESNADIRSGADLGLVKQNIMQLRELQNIKQCFNPVIGIEFVLMRQNLGELRNLRSLAYSMGANFIVLTNLLPYSKELKDQILYWDQTGASRYPLHRSNLFPDILLPYIDMSPETLEQLLPFLAGARTSQVFPNSNSEYCRFVGEGSIVVAWDGGISPCINFMHSYSCYIKGRDKLIKRYTLGNVGQENISEVWYKQDYVKFRDNVKRFVFAPCAECGGCELAESNEEDCIGNTFPVCGDCLWAKGLIQCP